MISQNVPIRILPNCRARMAHPGFAMTELVVAATLLLALISIVAPLAFRSGRMWQDTTRTRLALDELSNQLEILSRLDTSQRELALAELSVSTQIASQLPNAKLHGKVVSDINGTRLVLSLQWDRVGPAKPVSLVAWVDSLPSEARPAEVGPQEDDAPNKQEQEEEA